MKCGIKKNHKRELCPGGLMDYSVCCKTCKHTEKCREKGCLCGYVQNMETCGLEK